jgi:glucose-6-phosphate isomerase
MNPGDPAQTDAAQTDAAQTDPVQTDMAQTYPAPADLGPAELAPAEMVLPSARALDFATGDMVPHGRAVTRRLSEMGGAFASTEAVAALLAHGEDPVIYRSFVASAPERPGHLAYLTTIILAGEVGGEYYMTRGHYHQKDSAEVYLGMSGTGLMLMQDRDGQFRIEALANCVTVYVPPGWAHRTVNTGDQELVFLAVYFSDAGHDYRSIEEQGFAARVIAGANGPEVVGREAAI